MAERGSTAHQRPQERGVALLITVLSVALLTLAVMQFTFSTQVDYRRTAHWVKAKRAQMLADSGVAIAAEVLSYAPFLYYRVHQDRKLADGLTEYWAQRCDPPGPGVCRGEQARECAITLDDPDTALALQIDDETGLYNLNRLVGASQTERERFRKLSLAADISPATVESLRQWTNRAGTGLMFPLTARDGSASLRYRARAGAMKTFHELALLPTMSVAEISSLRRVATVLNRNVSKINVNTAPREVLRILDPALDDDAVLAKIEKARCTAPFSSFADLRTALEVDRALPYERLLGFRSEHFRVRATAAVGDVIQSVEALLHRPYPPDYARANRPEWEIQLMYRSVRRGPNIPGIDMSAAASLEDMGRSIGAEEGTP